MKNLSKNILFSIAVITLFLIIIEVALRAYLCLKHNDFQYLKPNLSAIVQHKRPVKIKVKKPSPIVDDKGRRQIGFLQRGFPYTNELLDFRGKVFAAKKEDGIKRILVFGGSAAYGALLNNADETMPVRLSYFLGRGYEVINCGYPAYKMEDIHRLFKDEMVNYEPDMIIIYAGWNDAFLPARPTRWLTIHNRLYYRWMLYTALLEFKHKIEKRFSGSSKKIPQHFYYNLKAVMRLAKDQNIEVVLVKEPVNLSQVDRRISSYVSREDSKSRLEEKYAGINDEDTRYLVKLYYYHRQMEELALKNNILLVDPVPILEKNNDLYIDIVHLNPAGAKALAALIADKIRRGDGLKLTY